MKSIKSLLLVAAMMSPMAAFGSENATTAAPAATTSSLVGTAQAGSVTPDFDRGGRGGGGRGGDHGGWGHGGWGRGHCDHWDRWHRYCW